MDDRHTRDSPFPGGTLMFQQVTLKSLAALEFAASSHIKSFGSRLASF
jgi:hypothetical protein